MSPTLRKFKKQVSAKKTTMEIIIISLMLILVTLSSMIVMLPSVKAGTGDFTNYKLITIDHDMIGATLTNFPVWVYNISDDFKDSDSGGSIQPDGDDIAFYSFDNNTQYNHEIEIYNGTTGEIGIWVNVTSVSDSADTKFWIYYGDADGSNQEDVAGTWDDNFVLVMHMDDYSAGQVNDSTQYINHGTKNSTEIGGVCGYGQTFVRANAEIVNCGHDAELDLSGTDSFTLECWFKTGSTESQKLISKDRVTTTKHRSWYFDVQNSDDKIRFYAAQDDDGTPNNQFQAISTDEVDHDLWNYGVIQVEWTDGTDLSYYQNGSLKSVRSFTISGINPSSASNDLTIGRHETASDNLDGEMDEVRISDIARSSDYIYATYNTSRFPSTFLTFGWQGGIEVSALSISGLSSNKLTFAVIKGESSWSNATNPGGTMNITWDVVTGDNVTEVRVNFSHPSLAQGIYNTNLSLAFSSDNTTWGTATQNYSGTNFTINKTQWNTYQNDGCYGDNPFNTTGMVGAGSYSIYLRATLSVPGTATSGTYTQTSCKVWWKRVY